MLKRLITFGFLICSVGAFAGPMWHCIANNAKGAVWNRYGQIHDETRSVVENECMPFNQDRTCQIICFPPREYYRCVSHDTLPPTKNLAKNVIQPKQGSWYWASFSKQIAINGARDACRHNSAFGGCYVDVDACASTKTN